MTQASAATARRSALWAMLAAFAAVCALVSVLFVTQADAQEDGDSSPSVEADSGDSGDDADSADEKSCDGRLGKGGRHFLGRKGLADRLDRMAELVGVEADALKEALKSGRSLADVAVENGVDPQVLIDAVAESIEDKADEMLEEGRIDAEKAAEMRAGAESTAAKIVNRTLPDDGGKHKGRRGHWSKESKEVAGSDAVT